MAKNQTTFKKGQSGNPAGKPKGVKNRSTKEMRELIQHVADKNLERLEDDLNLMSPSHRWQQIERLLKYVLPALTKNENSTEHSGGLTITVKYQDDSITKNKAANEDQE